MAKQSEYSDNYMCSTDMSLEDGVKIYAVFLALCKACLHALAAAPGLRKETRIWIMVVNSATLPAWCAAARGIGTR